MEGEPGQGKSQGISDIISMLCLQSGSAMEGESGQGKSQGSPVPGRSHGV